MKKSARGQCEGLHTSIEERLKLRLELGRRGAGYNDLFVSRAREKIHRLREIDIVRPVLQLHLVSGGLVVRGKIRSYHLCLHRPFPQRLNVCVVHVSAKRSIVRFDRRYQVAQQAARFGCRNHGRFGRRRWFAFPTLRNAMTVAVFSRCERLANLLRRWCKVAGRFPDTRGKLLNTENNHYQADNAN